MSRLACDKSVVRTQHVNALLLEESR